VVVVVVMMMVVGWHERDMDKKINFIFVDVLNRYQILI